MIFSEKWLREWVDPDISTDELVAQLTMAGLEVDGVEAAGGTFSGVVVGEIKECKPHPDADKLSLCWVSDGRDTYQVVCGAPNARAGIRVPFARVGAVLGKDFKIKKAKLRGVESQGMLCSADELGLAEDAEGLMELDISALPGQEFREYLGLDDSLIEVDLTPNRGDCLSIRGLAREVGVLNRTPVGETEIVPVEPTIEDSFPVELQSPEDCPRYLGRVIRGIDPSRGTPVWLQEKLRRSGLRSIDPVVDVTNYVLMEMGQPMHAFDHAKLSGGIRVRRAEAGEKLRLLDGKEVALRDDTLVIADHDKALAMAGVMGGLDSSVTESTRDIFLESAFFSPLSIAGKARSYGLQTDAAHRYERGVDFEMPRRAMERATELLLQFVGGDAGPIVDATQMLPERPRVRLRKARAASLLGVDLPPAEIEDILQRLGMNIESKDEERWEWEVRAPSWRFDIEIEADLIEELARIHGYDNLPASEPRARFSLKPRPEAVLGLPDLRRALAARGYQEVITYSFVEPKLEAAVGGRKGASIPLANPISQDMSVMRSTLWPGLLKTLKHNQNRQQARVRVFESGLRFWRDGNDAIRQTLGLGGLAWGGNRPEQWGESGRSNDFFDIKGDLESLLQLTLDPAAFSFEAAEHPALQPGQSARILREGLEMGWLGALNPAIQRELDIPGKVFLFELEMDVLAPSRLPVARELSRYPSVRRDLALVVDASLEASQILKVLQEQGGELLTDTVIFDVYQGQNIEKDKKSLALGLTFQHPSRTLNDDEINGIIESCINVLEARFNAELRK